MLEVRHQSVRHRLELNRYIGSGKIEKVLWEIQRLQSQPDRRYRMR